MDIRKAYDLLCLRDASNRAVWPFPTDFSIVVEQDGEEHHIRCDGWPIATAAAAYHTGRLNEASSSDDLDALIEQTRSSIDSGDLQLAELGAAWNQVYELVHHSD
jgi:hypothetical protein